MALTSVTFFCEGIPKGQPRPKACIRGKHAGIYDPGTASSWKEAVAWQAKAHRPDRPFSEQVAVQLDFHLPRPKYLSTGKRAALRNLPMLGKPDVDNLAKAVLDVMTQLGFWQDDAQVFSLQVNKVYADVGKRTGVAVFVDAPYCEAAADVAPSTTRVNRASPARDTIAPVSLSAAPTTTGDGSTTTAPVSS